MYKTVRHGDNCLQYTILPQTEEVLNNSGLRGKGRDYSPSIHIRRAHRKSTTKYVALVVTGVLITIAISTVPLFLMNGSLYGRRTQLQHHEKTELITNAPYAPMGRDLAKTRKKDLKLAPAVVPTLQSVITARTTNMPTSTSTILNNKLSSPPWLMPVFRLLKTTSAPSQTNEVQIQKLVTTPTKSVVSPTGKIVTNKPWDLDVIIRPTVTPEPATLNSISSIPKSGSAGSDFTSGTKMFEDVLITTKASLDIIEDDDSKLRDLKDALLSVDDDEEFKESLEVDEVFSLPPLKPEADILADNDEVTVSKAAWYNNRWPFVDTSSYFQWTGYSPGDNLLLPLLVAALSSVALVLLLALAVRRRKRTFTNSAQIGKLTAELQADDNTNLLTADNPEDAED